MGGQDSAPVVIVRVRLSGWDHMFFFGELIGTIT